MTSARPLNDESWPLGVPVPPRGEDLPYDDGEPMASGLHRKQMELLCNTLDDAPGRDDVYVAGNMAFYYSAKQAKKNDFKAPDVFVILEAEGHHERKSWVVWEEDLRTPNLVIELLSETTEANDRGPPPVARGQPHARPLDRHLPGPAQHVAAALRRRGEARPARRRTRGGGSAARGGGGGAGAGAPGRARASGRLRLGRSRQAKLSRRSR